MPRAHAGSVDLGHTFSEVHQWLDSNGPVELATERGTLFQASASVAKKGRHAGEPAIVFKERGAEVARAYACCWAHDHNCNRTRIGMYCAALDDSVG